MPLNKQESISNSPFRAGSNHVQHESQHWNHSSCVAHRHDQLISLHQGGPARTLPAELPDYNLHQILPCHFNPLFKFMLNGTKTGYFSNRPNIPII